MRRLRNISVGDAHNHRSMVTTREQVGGTATSMTEVVAGGGMVRGPREAGRAAHTQEGGADEDLINARLREHLTVPLVRVRELDVARTEVTKGVREPP